MDWESEQRCVEKLLQWNILGGVNEVLNVAAMHSKQFSSVHFDLITQEMLHLQYIGGFMQILGPISGGW